MTARKPKAAKNDADMIIGSAYDELKKRVEQFSSKDYPVLFYGETGSGKELFAKLYMEKSPRTGRKMTINCAAYSDGLLRDEIFGHVRGAFNDAISDRKGLIKTCDGGIACLDELGASSKEFQAAILRIVEEKNIKQLGSDEEIDVDTLIIAATNDLSHIRQDLRQRFHIIFIPPLQKNDIPALVTHFSGKSLKKKYIDELMNLNYPGNVRQLKKCYEKLHAEKGDDIFSSRDSDDIGGVSTFDYQRYCSEVEIWNELVQPILNKYNYTNIKYQYQQWDDNWIDEKSPDNVPSKIYWIKLSDHGLDKLSGNDRFSMNDWELHGLSTYEIFITLAKGVEFMSEVDITPSEEGGELPALEKFPMLFRHHLISHIQSGTLPYLLKYLQTTMTKKHNSTPASKPPLTNLLEMPIHEAITAFEKTYWEYNRRVCESTESLASKAGMTVKTMNQKINRLYDKK